MSSLDFSSGGLRSSKEKKLILPFSAKNPSSPLMSPLLFGSVLVEKVLKSANFSKSRKVRFFVSDCNRAASASKFARLQCAKAAQDRVFRSEPDSPPRFRPAARQPAELVTADVTAPSGPVFGAKSAQNGQLRRVRFSVSDGKWDA